MVPRKSEKSGRYKHHLPPTTGPLAEFYELWSESLERREVAESARNNYISRVHRFYSLILGTFSLEDVLATKAGDLVDGFARLAMPTGTEKAYWNTMGQFFAFAAEQGLISKSPMDALRQPDPRKKKKLGSADLEAFLDQWCWSLRPKPAPNVWKTHRRKILALLDVASLPLEKTSVSKLTLLHVRDRFIAKWPSTQGRRRTLFVIYEKFFDFVVSTGTIDTNPLQGRWHLFRSKEHERSSDEKVVLTKDDVEAVEHVFRTSGHPDWVKVQDLALASLFYRQRLTPAQALTLTKDALPDAARAGRQSGEPRESCHMAVWSVGRKRLGNR